MKREIHKPVQQNSQQTEKRAKASHANRRIVLSAQTLESLAQEKKERRQGHPQPHQPHFDQDL